MRLTTGIDAPPAAVFAAVADFANLAAWDPFVRSATLEEGRPLRPGAVYTLHGTGGLTLHYLVIESEPGKRIVYRGGTRRVASTDMIEVSATAEGAIVTITSELEFSGWTRAIALPMRALVWLGGRFVSLPALRRHCASLPAVET